MINKIFVYDELLTDDVINKLNIKPTHYYLSQIEGKLFIFNQMMMLFEPDVVTRGRYNKRVIGAIYEYPMEEMETILDKIDTYKCCSKSRIGLNHPFDFTYRTISTVYPISFDNIHDFSLYKYKLLNPVQCWVYYGNDKLDKISKHIKHNRHGRVVSGCHENGIKELLVKLKYMK